MELMERDKILYKQPKSKFIPEDWKISPLQEIADKITDGEHLTPKRSKSGFYLLSARNIRNGKLDVSDVDYVELEEYNRIKNRCNPETGDVLISCSGTIGRVSIVPENFDCVLVRSAALIKPSFQKLDGKYLQYYLQSDPCQNQIKASVNQGAQPNLFLNHIEKIEVRYPSFFEQEAIATAIGDTDALIVGLEKLIAKKKAIKQGAMQHLLTPPHKGGKRLPGFTGDWEEKRLGDYCGITTGKLDANAMDIDGDYPFYTCAKKVYTINKYAFETEALLISGNGANVGYIHYFKGKFNAYQRTYVLDNFSLNIHFIKYVLDVELSKRIATEKKDGNTPYIVMDTLTDMLLVLPNSPEEQRAIAVILNDMDKEIEALEAKKTKFEKIKQGMMQELLTGKTRLV
jgi:type I restriction enzyme S subunit